MKRVCVCTAIALAGCSTATNDVVPTQLSPTQYSSYGCERLTAELRRMYTRVDELAHLGGTAAEYARLSDEHHALREAAIMKKCARTLAPPVQRAAPNPPDDQSGTGPTIAPPQVPRSAPEVGLRAARRPGEVHFDEAAIAAQNPVADLLPDEQLLFAVQVVHSALPHCGENTFHASTAIALFD